MRKQVCKERERERERERRLEKTRPGYPSMTERTLLYTQARTASVLPPYPDPIPDPPDGIHVPSPPAIQCHRMALMGMPPWILQTETSARDRRNCCGCFHGEIFPTEAPKRLAARTRCSRPAVLAGRPLPAYRPARVSLSERPAVESPFTWSLLVGFH